MHGREREVVVEEEVEGEMKRSVSVSEYVQK